MSSKDFDKAINFISELYVKHNQFDKDKILNNKHEPKSIHSSKMKILLGRHYKPILNKLVDLKIVEVLRSYAPGAFSHGYRLTRDVLQQNFVKVRENPHWKADREREEVLSGLEPIYQRIVAAASELRFDYASAIDFISKETSLSDLQKNWYQNFSELARDHDFTACVCQQGRLYYMLTTCPRLLRRFFTVKGSNLVMIDVKSSQVLLHTSLYPEPCAEKAHFDEICSTGKFWALINSKLKTPFDLTNPEEKRKLKEECFQKLFYTALDFVYANTRIVQEFRSYWPQLHKLIRERKWELKKVNKNLACQMQLLESTIIIKNALAALQEMFPESIFLTIHDCIVCEEGRIEEVKSALNDAFGRTIGVKPGLDVTAMDPESDLVMY